MGMAYWPARLYRILRPSVPPILQGVPGIGVGSITFGLLPLMGSPATVGIVDAATTAGLTASASS